MAYAMQVTLLLSSCYQTMALRQTICDTALLEWRPSVEALSFRALSVYQFYSSQLFSWSLFFNISHLLFLSCFSVYIAVNNSFQPVLIALLLSLC